MSHSQYQYRGIIHVLFLSLLVTRLLCPAALRAQEGHETVIATVQQMEQAASAPIETVHSQDTGLVTFLTTLADHLIPLHGMDQALPQDRALAFLTTYGPAFGLLDPTHFHVMRVEEVDEVGMSHVRFQQQVNGVPVTAGELTVHLRGANVVAVLARTVPVLDTVSTIPTVSSEEALQTVKAALAKHMGVTDPVLSPPGWNSSTAATWKTVRLPRS